MNGTANEETMLNYYSRTIEPIINAITLELKRKFLTKTARTQGQTIMYFRDPFTLVPSKELAELADKFTRNEILTSNEIRGIIGFKPSSDPKADELLNSNLNHASEEKSYDQIPTDEEYIDEESMVDDANLQNGNGYSQEEMQNVFDTLTDEQKNAVYYVIDEYLDNGQKTEGR